MNGGKNYGEKIKKYLDENGIKYTFLASEVGISMNTLSSMLNQKRKITIEEYALICKALKLDFSFFDN